jgi:hypothetical protein
MMIERITMNFEDNYWIIKGVLNGKNRTSVKSV